MSGILKQKLSQGTTWRLGLVPAHISNGVETPWDLTGCEFVFEVLHDTDRWIQSFPVTVDADGVVRLHLPAATTSRLSTNRRYYYRVDIIFPSGDRRRVLEGPLYANE